jgi:hypothetical protein
MNANADTNETTKMMMRRMAPSEMVRNLLNRQPGQSTKSHPPQPDGPETFPAELVVGRRIWGF